LLFNKNQKDLTPDAQEYVEHLVSKNVSGRLKIAPEHTEDEVLKLMRKPSFSLFYRFKEIFDKINTQKGLNQQLIPYFISSHPGSHEKDMVNLALRTKEVNFKLEQVQDFTPTPMTLATVIFYSGYNPYTRKETFTAKDQEDKKKQRMYFFWYKPEVAGKIKARLKKIAPTMVKEFFSPKEEKFVPHHARKAKAQNGKKQYIKNKNSNSRKKK